MFTFDRSNGAMQIIKGDGLMFYKFYKYDKMIANLSYEGTFFFFFS